MKILFASGNAHKRAEMAALFPGHDLFIPREIGLPFDPEEDGETFLENAMIKAQALRASWEGPILADDSGICVDALGGAPGIFSARFGASDGVDLSSMERNALLLERMRGVRERSCRFVCAMVLSVDAARFMCAQETLEGVLLESPRGTGGFGYDPVVFLPDRGVSVAELSEEEKNAISHRGKAAKRIKAALEAL